MSYGLLQQFNESLIGHYMQSMAISASAAAVLCRRRCRRCRCRRRRGMTPPARVDVQQALVFINERLAARAFGAIPFPKPNKKQANKRMKIAVSPVALPSLSLFLSLRLSLHITCIYLNASTSCTERHVSA